jgi:hypothetical protein
VSWCLCGKKGIQGRLPLRHKGSQCKNDKDPIKQTTIMKYLKVFIIILFFTIPVLGQKGYYSTDSLIISGVDVGRSNSYFCYVKKGGVFVKLDPHEVNEYGLVGGRAHKVFDIVLNGEKKRYFLERMVDGKITLYNLKLKKGINNYYIVTSDNPHLRQLPMKKTELRNLIGTYADSCPIAAQNLKYLKPEGHSLKKYLSYLNSCNDLPYPKFHYGFRAGIAATQFYPVVKTSMIAAPDYGSDISYKIGAFLDIPILSGNLSFVPGINYKRNHYSRTFEKNSMDFDLLLNYSSIDLPILFKYRFLRRGNIPFLEIGPVYSDVIKDRAILYQYRTLDNDTFIEINDTPLIRNNMAGFCVGAGMERYSHKKYKWFWEVQYNYQSTLSSIHNQFNLGELSVNTGLIF